MRPHPAPRARHVRAGFTVTELLVAAVLFVLLLAMALPFLSLQSRTISASAGRLDAGQTARFAQNTIDRDLRMAGANTTAEQPMLVQAGPFAVTFNADVTTRDPDDVWAIYYDPDEENGAVVALQPPALVLPVSGFQYPRVNMLDRSGLPGRAETISYWVRRDSSSTNADEYVLFRQVNRNPPRVVATGLYLASGQPFFQYLWVRDSTGVIDTVPAARLPLLHAAERHGSPADTGETATIASRIDRVRAVIVNATGQFRDPRAGGGMQRRVVRNNTALVNATMLNRPSCGLAPDATTLTASVVYENGQPSHVALRWPRALDDGNGERDVRRYLLYRSVNGAAFAEPFDEVPAGEVNYAYDDHDVKRPPTVDNPVNNTFRYGVVAQDCQPQVSTVASSAVLTIPVIP